MDTSALEDPGLGRPDPGPRPLHRRGQPGLQLRGARPGGGRSGVCWEGGEKRKGRVCLGQRLFPGLGDPQPHVGNLQLPWAGGLGVLVVAIQGARKRQHERQRHRGEEDPGFEEYQANLDKPTWYDRLLERLDALWVTAPVTRGGVRGSVRTTAPPPMVYWTLPGEPPRAVPGAFVTGTQPPPARVYVQRSPSPWMGSPIGAGERVLVQQAPQTQMKWSSGSTPPAGPGGIIRRISPQGTPQSRTRGSRRSTPQQGRRSGQGTPQTPPPPPPVEWETTFIPPPGSFLPPGGPAMPASGPAQFQWHTAPAVGGRGPVRRSTSGGPGGAGNVPGGAVPGGGGSVLPARNGSLTSQERSESGSPVVWGTMIPGTSIPVGAGARPNGAGMLQRPPPPGNTAGRQG